MFAAAPLAGLVVIFEELPELLALVDVAELPEADEPPLDDLVYASMRVYSSLQSTLRAE